MSDPLLPNAHTDGRAGETRLSRRALLGALPSALSLPALPAFAQQRGAGTFSAQELVNNGHRFFGGATRGIASIMEQAVGRWGHPNGYILGQEGGGAFFAGVRYGEGTLYTKSWGERKVFWQGPSLGFDVGGDGDRTMMLVYKLAGLQAIDRRFVGLDGSAYIVGGVGMTALVNEGMVVVPIRTGVGARLGINIGYLKFTERPTWNPF